MSGLAVTDRGPDVARLRGRVFITGALDVQEVNGDRFGGTGGHQEPGSVVTLMQQVEAALKDLAAGGAWPGRAPAGQPFPYITFFRVLRANELTFEGPTDLQPSRIQVDVFSVRYGEAAAIGARVRDRMLERFTVGSIDEQDLPPDPEVDAYRVSIDFGLWSKSA